MENNNKEIMNNSNVSTEVALAKLDKLITSIEKLNESLNSSQVELKNLEKALSNKSTLIEIKALFKNEKDSQKTFKL